MKKILITMAVVAIAIAGCRPEKFEAPVSDANKNFGTIRSRGSADVGNVIPGGGETALISQEVLETFSNYEYDYYNEEPVDERGVILITIYFSDENERFRFIQNECDHTYSEPNGVKTCNGLPSNCYFNICDDGVEIVLCPPAI